jgi:hypothetical protein
MKNDTSFLLVIPEGSTVMVFPLIEMLAPLVESGAYDAPYALEVLQMAWPETMQFGLVFEGCTEMSKVTAEPPT